MEAASSLTFNGIHGVISQKIELFITTGVRYSNPSLTIKFEPPDHCNVA
jgi:hypothetical protein